MVGSNGGRDGVGHERMSNGEERFMAMWRIEDSPFNRAKLFKSETAFL